MEKFIEYYMERVNIGHYVPCEICGHLHDDGGLTEYNGKEVYACLDCLEAVEINKGEVSNGTK